MRLLLPISVALMLLGLVVEDHVTVQHFRTLDQEELLAVRGGQGGVCFVDDPGNCPGGTTTKCADSWCGYVGGTCGENGTVYRHQTQPTFSNIAEGGPGYKEKIEELPISIYCTETETCPSDCEYHVLAQPPGYYCKDGTLEDADIRYQWKENDSTPECSGES